MSQLRPALVVLLVLTLLTGGVYPLVTTLLGQWWFPWQSQGSLLTRGDQIRGSALLGQNFTAAGYFQGRPLPPPVCRIILRPQEQATWPSVTLKPRS